MRRAREPARFPLALRAASLAVSSCWLPPGPCLSANRCSLPPGGASRRHIGRDLSPLTPPSLTCSLDGRRAIRQSIERGRPSPLTDPFQTCSLSIVRHVRPLGCADRDPLPFLRVRKLSAEIACAFTRPLLSTRVGDRCSMDVRWRDAPHFTCGTAFPSLLRDHLATGGCFCEVERA